MAFKPALIPADVPVVSSPLPGPRAALHAWLAQGWRAAQGDVPLPWGAWNACPVPDADLTHAGALQAARALGQPPRKVAEAWAASLGSHPHVAQVTVVGPGHLNLALTPAGRQALLGDSAPFEPAPPKAPLLLEFVSANPTGPLHVGHARQAVLGDTLARLLRHVGHPVGTEFYTNDAGAQIHWLTVSVALRMREHGGAVLVFERDTPEGEPLPPLPPQGLYFPRDGYHGSDIIAIAQQAVAQGLSPDDTPAVKAFAVQAQSEHQRATLTQLGVAFDGLTSERALHETGEVAAVVEALKPHAYWATHAHQDPEPETPSAPAWFLDTVTFGDQKDRVMVKSNGEVPYFVPDVAYHLDKWNRGWAQALNIQGADHHGTLARVQAGVQWLGLPTGYPQVMFHTMVTVLKDGQPLVASKRAGTALSADDLMAALGVDAFRMAMLDKAPESPLTLDVDAWVSEGLNNPVYAVQYANARLHALLTQAHAAPPGDQVVSWCPAEHTLSKAVMLWEDQVTRAALAHEPVKAAHALRALANTVHAAYQQGPKLRTLTAEAREERVLLYGAAQAALHEGHRLLGIAVKTRMEKVPEEPARPQVKASRRPS